MKPHHLLPALLPAAVTAVDIRVWPQTGCSGSYHALFTNANPNICYATSNVENWDYHSVAFYGINPSWNINYRAHGGGACRTLVMSQTVNFGTFWCLGDRGDAITVTGAGYSFVGRRGRKRDAAQECVRPDTLVFEDGTRYNLTVLDEGGYESLMKDVAKGTPAADVLAEIKID
ncbi:hypothetical protein QBC34DRAFT_383706 [Podospora aff. communis PSN243]|uniref:Uncharacterized protein n=1 Tax=Podospora aff. communis PSN243 TaxID=3040156 RepID=A0AAV9GGE7_9PEZI|nr:hypothetical protein QBC34DRAFT_383706 [Podospora aff. communis PSN243]